MRRPAAGLADQAECREPCEEGFVDRRALPDQDDRLCSAYLRHALLQRLGAFRVDDDVVTASEGEAVEALDGALVVLHHDDVHRLEPSSGPAGGAAAGAPGAAIPHGCYDSS